MKKWYCRNCGNFEYSHDRPYSGTCNMSIRYAKMRISSNKSDVSLPQNHRVHGWEDADQYLRENGDFPNLRDLDRQFKLAQEEDKIINDFVKDKYGNDLFLPNGDLNEYYRAPNSSNSEQNSTSGYTRDEMMDGLAWMRKTIQIRDEREANNTASDTNNQSNQSNNSTSYLDYSGYEKDRIIIDKRTGCHADICKCGTC